MIKKLSEQDEKRLCETACEVKKQIIKMINNASSGHPGGSLSASDLMTVLYFNHMKHYKEWDKHPDWANRDRFILSKGHASPVLYAVLAESGYFDKEELMTFRIFGSRLQGHPCFGLPGVEVPTGSLGQGLSIACGMALGLKLDKKSSRVYTILGDGETQEGQVWEAAMHASHKKLGNLIAIIDRNTLQIDGSTESIKGLDPVDKKWESFGWQVLKINGHNHQEINEALQKAVMLGEENSKPVAIIAKTVKGKGVSFMENNCGWHGKAPNNDDAKKALEELGNSH